MAEEKRPLESEPQAAPEASTPDVPGAPAPDLSGDISQPVHDGPAQPDPGDVVISFEKIDELLKERRDAAREKVEQESPPEPSAEGGKEEKTKPEPEQPKPRRGRPPKEKAVSEDKDTKAATPRRGRPPKADKAAPDKATPPKPRDKVSQGGVRQQASIPVVLACCVSPPNSGRRSINLRRRFTVKLTTQELEQMRSVDIGAVAAESLPDVSGMTFDNALSRKERISRFLQTVKNPYCFCIGGVGVKIEFAESGPSLQDKLTDFLLRQRSGL